MVQPPPAYVTPLWLATCAVAVHAGGTDNLPTSVLPEVFTETPTFGTPAGVGNGAAGWGVIRPVTPAPPGVDSTLGCNELMSANPLVIAGVTIAGLTYEPDTKPFTKLEFRKVPREFPSAPSKKSRKSPNQPCGFAAADSGDVSCCSDDGTLESTCCN